MSVEALAMAATIGCGTGRRKNPSARLAGRVLRPSAVAMTAEGFQLDRPLAHRGALVSVRPHR